jgi:hypothetical protein
VNESIVVVVVTTLLYSTLEHKERIDYLSKMPIPLVYYCTKTSRNGIVYNIERRSTRVVAQRQPAGEQWDAPPSPSQGDTEEKESLLPMGSSSSRSTDDGETITQDQQRKKKKRKPMRYE